MNKGEQWPSGMVSDSIKRYIIFGCAVEQVTLTHDNIGSTQESLSLNKTLLTGTLNDKTSKKRKLHLT